MSQSNARLRFGLLLALAVVATCLIWLRLGAIPGILVAALCVAAILQLRKVDVQRGIAGFRQGYSHHSKRIWIALSIGILAGGVWLAVEVRRAKRQHDIVAKLPPTGAHVIYDYQMGDGGRVVRTAKHPWPNWLRQMLGSDIFTSVSEISYPKQGTVVTDADVALLSGLTRLRRLYLGLAPITDASVPYLQTLTGLEKLDVVGTRITPVGLKKLMSALPQCEINY